MSLESQFPRTCILKFTASWCGPCQVVQQLIDESELEQHIKVVKIDVDEQEELASNYEITSIPVLVFMEDGAETYRIQGAQKELILQKITEFKNKNAKNQITIPFSKEASLGRNEGAVQQKAKD